ncbi:DUF1963 domain-containing protein [bacterium]|nr:MAG: DUF1963 domain-containing protein [bacterium]
MSQIDSLPASARAYEAQIRKAALPCLRGEAMERECQSHLGGEVVLPAGVAWPLCEDGRPLAHLASIDLSELPRIEANTLPADGTLLFFYDTEEQPWGMEGEPEDWRVLYRLADDAGTLVEGASEPETRINLAFGTAISYSDELELPLSQEAYEDYFDWLHVGDHPLQMLGHELPIQSPLSQLFENPKLLLQVPSDGAFGYEWGDGGNLYFVMSPQDMAAGRFENVRFTFQCH